MASFNKIIIIGNLTKDPIQNDACVKLSVATNHRYKTKEGATVDDACFFDVDVWGTQAKSCMDYLRKGRSVLIEGRMKQNNWQDEQGNKRSKMSVRAESVTFLDAKEATESAPAAFEKPKYAKPQEFNSAKMVEQLTFNTDLPF